MIKIITWIFIAIVYINVSCQRKEACSEKSDNVTFLTEYNSNYWLRMLYLRHSKDTLLNNRLLKLSETLGNFGVLVIRKTGGLEPGTLNISFPCSKPKVNDEDLDFFYTELKKNLDIIGTNQQYYDVYTEVNSVIDYHFFDTESPLCRQNITNSNVVFVVEKIFLLQNMCFYYIIKYT